MSEVWVLRWEAGHDNESELIGVYTSEPLAKAACERDIASRYAGNPNAKPYWDSYNKQPGIMTSVSIYFGCGHSDYYTWDCYDVQGE